MDKYAETAFMLIALGLLVVSGSIAMWVRDIQRDLQAWHEEWKVSQGGGKGDLFSDS